MKRCLVMGGSGNIGSEICKNLSKQDTVLGFTYFQGWVKSKLLSEEIKGSRFHVCDFTKAESIDTAVKELVDPEHGLDAMICAVGFPGRFNLKLGETLDSDFNASVEVNARGVMLACKAALPALRKSKSANIVILGSMDGTKAVPSPIHFAASKSALTGMVQSMARELGVDGIKVNLIIPGVVEGGASAHLTENLKKEYLKYCSLKRFARPSEIAEVAAWFAFQNTYVTGQSILLNGGL